MKGFRTFLFGLVIAVLGWLQANGNDVIGAIDVALLYIRDNFDALKGIIPEQWEAVGLQVIGILVMFFRAITSTPPFKKQ